MNTALPQQRIVWLDVIRLAVMAICISVWGFAALVYKLFEKKTAYIMG